MHCKSRSSICVFGIITGFVVTLLVQNIALSNTVILCNVPYLTPLRRHELPVRDASDGLTPRQDDAGDQEEPEDKLRTQRSLSIAGEPEDDSPPESWLDDFHQEQDGEPVVPDEPIHVLPAKTSANSTPPVYKMSDELAPRTPLLIAVITSSMHRSRLGSRSQIMSIHRTWAKAPARVIYFVAGNIHSISRRFPHGVELVQLEGIKDEQSNWDAKESAVIQYLTNHRLIVEVDWFLVVSDKVFVNTAGLQSKLESYRSSGSVYMGRSVSETRKCNHLTGVVYSQGLLSHLKEHLSKCQLKGQSVSDCITNKGIHCTQAEETLDLFYLDNNGLIETNSLFTTKDIAEAMTVYPVRFSKHMYRLFNYFQEVAYNASKEQGRKIANKIHTTNFFIPSRLRSSFKPENVGQKKAAKDKKQPTPEKQPATTAPSTHVKPPFVPKSRFEVINWDYLNKSHIHSLDNERPLTGIIGGLRQEFRFAQSKALHIASEWSFPKRHILLENSYHRIDPMRGSEYIFDFTLRRSSRRKRKFQKKRVHILRPFQETVVTVSSSVPQSRPVHFIVTLSGLSNRLEQFLTNFQKNVLPENKDASLTIVLFNGTDTEKVHRLVSSHHSDSRIFVLDVEGEFARGIGLDYGAARFKDDDLLFFVDIDLEISTGFVDRCAFNTAPGQSVYFPIFFKLYNLDFVSRYHRGYENRFYSRHNGHWAHYSYGMVCIYAGDYRKSGGFNTRMHGWGGEDVDFFNRVMHQKLEIFRSPDPGLVHLWHRKICDEDRLRSKEVYVSCMQSKAENLADRRELAFYVFENELKQGNVL